VKLLTLKLEEAEWERWKGKARDSSLTLSAWIRKQCSPEIVTQEDIAQEQMKARTAEGFRFLQRKVLSYGGVESAKEPSKPMGLNPSARQP